MADAPKPAPKLLPPKKESPAMSFFSNALAIAGFIILTFIVMWGVVHIVSLSGFSFGSWLRSTPSITVSAPKNALSGQSVTISWKNNQTTSGDYSLIYKCANNFQFAAAGENGAMNRVPCGASVNVGVAASVTLVPIVSGTSTVSVPVTIVFTPTNADGTRVEGGATIAVAPPAIPASAPVAQTAIKPVARSVAATKPSYSRTKNLTHYSPVAHAASGPADLSVRIIATGYIDPASGALLMNRAPMPGDVVGVEFDIANVGGSASGAYYFQAHLPTVSNYDYTSPVQASLAPGAHVVNTLRFTGLSYNGGMFTVVVDPSARVNDADRANNESAVTIY